jgi:hypothetical protein
MLWPFTSVPLRVGKRLDIEVRNESGDTVELIEVAHGQCRLLVVSSKRCRYCLDLLERWRGILRAQETRYPEGWVLLWILIEKDGGDFFLEEDPFLHFSSVRWAEILRRTTLRGTPAFITVDRDGTITGMDVGPTYPTDSLLTTDCTIVG